MIGLCTRTVERWVGEIVYDADGIRSLTDRRMVLSESGRWALTTGRVGRRPVAGRRDETASGEFERVDLLY